VYKNRRCRYWWTLTVSPFTPIENPFIIHILCHHIYLLCFFVWTVNYVLFIEKKIWLLEKNVKNIETLTRKYNFSWIINIYGISIHRLCEIQHYLFECACLIYYALNPLKYTWAFRYILCWKYAWDRFFVCINFHKQPMTFCLSGYVPIQHTRTPNWTQLHFLNDHPTILRKFIINKSKHCTYL